MTGMRVIFLFSLLLQYPKTLEEINDAYKDNPLIKGKDGNMRPYLYSGLFVGDESHRPGRVIWQGSASTYIPNDSIHAESDTTHIRNLFDKKTKRLKKLYFYWGAVQPCPCPTKTEQPLDYQSVVVSEQPTVAAEPMNFAKVASTFWSVKPVRVG